MNFIGTIGGAEKRFGGLQVEKTKLKRSDLIQNNGKQGRPAWVAVKGQVYDLSESKLWKGGEHMKRHQAGEDLSSEIMAAPHGLEVLDREVVKKLGPLLEEAPEPDIPVFLEKLFRRFPILRRHPHPMMVHFPMAYLVGAAFLLLAQIAAPSWIVLEEAAFVMLVMAVLFTPPAIVTGLLTWWVNYGARPMHAVKRKLQLAVLLAFLEMVSLLLRFKGPVQGDLSESIYAGCMGLMAFCVVGLGWYGGHLTFPYEKRTKYGG